MAAATEVSRCILEAVSYLELDETRIGRLAAERSADDRRAQLRRSKNVFQRHLQHARLPEVAAILLGHEVFYVDVVQGRNPFPMASRIGTLRPLYCTAMGKALASTLRSPERERLFSSLRFFNFTPNTINGVPRFRDELSRIQMQGYAVDNEEAVLGARCVSVSMDLWGGKLLAAVSVSAPVARMRRDEIPSFASTLRDVARKIAANLGSLGPPAGSLVCGNS